MARSPKDDPRYNDMHTWDYRCETGENSAPGGINEMNQPSHTKTGGMSDNNMFVNVNSYCNDVYGNNKYNVQTGDPVPVNDENLSFNSLPNVSRHNYGNAMLSLDNGDLLRVFYDKNNRKLIFPNQYELFNHNTVLPEMPLQNTQHNHLFNEFALNNNNIQMQGNSQTQSSFGQDNLNSQSQVPTSNILKEVLGNLESKPNPTGSYSPFGQNYPLNHPDASLMNILQNNNPLIETPMLLKKDNSPKRNDSSPLVDTSNKKRIVAEVKPMRPSYSDVLAKNMKNTQADVTRKVKQPSETKPVCNKTTKSEKQGSNMKHITDDNKIKSEKKQPSTISSGSESGDFNETDKMHKPSKRTKNKKSNMPKKWSSVDDVANEEDPTFSHGNESQFVYIETQPEKPKKEKKPEKQKSPDLNFAKEENFDVYEEDKSETIQDNQSESSKIKKKKEKSYYKTPKPVQDKKKGVQVKWKRNKPGYLGVAQNYLENWGGASWKAISWFIYLLSDICRMSAHLSFDLCTTVFTQTYVSSQAVWRSSKMWFYKIGDNKFLNYIDRKLGHTRFGFWRKLKWFKKESELDNGNENGKLNANIPLPATGEEAMKRLLACKGKDPYSILGVNVSCTDEEIKRYYRRQAFLVHPDKNQQPGAEEAFKILQHAFDLIGEPERREAYDRRKLESRHVEAAWSELSTLLAQLHDKMEFAANTIRCTNCGRRHKRVLTDRPCYAARYCAQCKIRHSAKEGDIWSESGMMGLLVMYYACMDGAVYQITHWASCQKKNLKQLRPDSHVVQYRIVLGNKAAATSEFTQQRPSSAHEPNLEEFLNNLYSKSSANGPPPPRRPAADASDAKKKRNKKMA